jgi:hypothetical protein
VARCECCGTAWLARAFDDDAFARALWASPRRPVIIEGEVMRRGASAAGVERPRREAGFDARRYYAGSRGGADPHLSSPFQGEGRGGVGASNAAHASSAAQSNGNRPAQAGPTGWRAAGRRLGHACVALALALIGAFAGPIVTASPDMAGLSQGGLLAFSRVKSTFLRIQARTRSWSKASSVT